MDRFVTRTPTWKTLNYSLMAAENLTKNSSAINKKQPLQQKQLNITSSHYYEFDKHLMSLLPNSNQTNEENFNANSNDSGLSSGSSVSPQRLDDNVVSTKSHFGKLADYIDCPVEKENDTYITITRTPKTHGKVIKSGGQDQGILEVDQTSSPQVADTRDRAVSISKNIMARIRKDFNSPSAAARMKAIKALKSPTKSEYTHFDIPDAEQSLHLPEPPSLKEVMRNIVIYVEIRSGEDNRSAGVRKVIETLGARVCSSLNRETTHVVFKDGLMSTFKKAKQMNIPIVSILWIEACKNQRRICDPKDYPISNLDRYENPELYTKMKRIKCMQPDSECNKRIRGKAGGTPKDSTPIQKTGNNKRNSIVVVDTPINTIHKKKTDISQFFKKIEKKTPTSASKADGGGGDNVQKTVSQSPVTKDNANAKNCCDDSLKNGVNPPKFGIRAKKALDFHHSNNAKESSQANIGENISAGTNTSNETVPLAKTNTRPRRSSLMGNSDIETATNSMNAMAISGCTSTKTMNRRRSSVHAPENMSVVGDTSRNVLSVVKEDNEVDKNQEHPPKPLNKRRTLYVTKTMDETQFSKTEKNKSDISRRRTLYTSTTMETSDITDIIINNVLPNSLAKRRTCLNLKSLDETQIPEVASTKAAYTPNIEATSTRKDPDLTNGMELNTPTSVKGDKSLNCRRTLYEPQQGASEQSTDTDTFTSTTSNICPTSTAFQKGKVASSTLLDDGDDRSKLLATPPADATAGKLVEETEQSTIPLIFSSIRKPGNKRRTLFDVSMDIITQRLHCINQSARRSLAAPAAALTPTPTAEVINTLENHTPKNMTPISDSLTEAQNQCTNANDGLGTITPQASTLIKKKRKLFVPNDMPATPPPPSSESLASLKPTDKQDESDKWCSSISNGSIVNSAVKRRRTLMPISQPQLTICTEITPVSRKRRSTLDFEQTPHNKTQHEKAATNTSLPSAAKKSSQQQLKSVLVYTNMHQQQIDVIRETVKKLGVFELENFVTDATTHIVSLEARRTLNLLRALTRGIWILDYSWIRDSLNANKWLPEESYELKGFSKGIEICRSERQAFGREYTCDLFRDVGSFYVSSNCYPISKGNMCELITLCGGYIVHSRQKARYIIGSSNGKLVDKLYLSPYWILDCITEMQLMRTNKYVCSSRDGNLLSQDVSPNRGKKK